MQMQHRKHPRLAINKRRNALAQSVYSSGLDLVDTEHACHPVEEQMADQQGHSRSNGCR